MKLWVGLWVEVFRVFDANPLKEMVGTRRLELLTSTVSINRLETNTLDVLPARLQLPKCTYARLHRHRNGARGQ